MFKYSDHMLLKNPVSDTSTQVESGNLKGVNYMKMICLIWMRYWF